MAGIEDDIIKWVGKAPVWQRNLIKRIARGEAIDSAYIETIAKALVGNSIVEETPVLTALDLPSGAPADATTRFVSVGELENINALLGGQNLTFGLDGITVVYGDNGTGKSGYARLVKHIVGARHREDILPDAFAASTGTQRAKIVLESKHGRLAGDWATLDDASLQQVHFYDKACGEDYLDRESELNYRPSVLGVFDQLIKYIDMVKASIDELARISRLSMFVPPALTQGTSVQKLLLNLSLTTSEADVDSLLTLEEDTQQKLAALTLEEARLKTTDPHKEKERLLQGASRVDALAIHLEDATRLLSVGAGSRVIDEQAGAKKLRSAASDASKSSFAKEPLAKVGSESWRILWESAERFSMDGAYPDQNFPVVNNGSLCVLCQQPLGDEARDRLTRFHQFIHNDVATRAREAEQKFVYSQKAITEFEVSTTESTAAIEFIKKDHKELSEKLDLALVMAQRAKERLGERLRGDSQEDLIVLEDVDVATLRLLASSARTKSDEIDETEFRNSLAVTTNAMNELKDKLSVAHQKDAVMAELLRLRYEKTLRDLSRGISTTLATKESAELARKYVTDVVKDRFVHESKHLKLEHVVLGDKGGAKGKLRHQPALLGSVGKSPRQVLSEGEQTAAGLAGFFTEVHFDESKSAVVFDDPTSSLDHERRDKAARRVVELARDRQVIVFTHDLVFLGEIVKNAGEFKVPVSERTIERTGAKQPGRVIDNHPWKARDAKARLASLETELDGLKDKQSAMSSEEFEKASSDWAGMVSETWERIVRSEIVFTAVDRGTGNVQPKQFRVFAKVTDQDNSDFQTGFGTVTTWARRHDKSEETNYTAPTIAEMELELKRIQDFWGGVKQYTNS
jgi:energy-coupling factor transporter ATP-binding protein EcfA2